MAVKCTVCVQDKLKTKGRSSFKQIPQQCFSQFVCLNDGPWCNKTFQIYNLINCGFLRMFQPIKKFHLHEMFTYIFFKYVKTKISSRLNSKTKQLNTVQVWWFHTTFLEPGSEIVTVKTKAQIFLYVNRAQND